MSKDSGIRPILGENGCLFRCFSAKLKQPIMIAAGAQTPHQILVVDDEPDLEITIRKTLDHVVRMRQAIASQEQLEAIQYELGVAARIQQSILPRKFPPFPERTDFELHAAMVPAKEVGGDLFDFFLLDEDHLGLVLGDVSGKGVPAALFMAVSRTLLRD